MNCFPSITHWQFLHGEPTSSGVLKANNADFYVNEVLPFSPTGEGEHLFVQIEKDNLNTGFVAQALAKHFKVKERDVGYAGRKDKFAVTRQWFSIWLPGNCSIETNTFKLDGCRIIRADRHDKKLRTGALAENEFRIVLRDFAQGSEFMERINAVKSIGVPNYFGPQRFGNINDKGIAGNLVLAQYLLNGETIKKREKRSMAISALRSWLCNEYISERIKQHHLKFIHGDALSLSGSNSFFCVEELDNETQQRLTQRDVQLSVPLWGKGSLATLDKALTFETQLANEQTEICDVLAQLGLKQERRKMLLFPKKLTADLKETQLTLNFSLPPGCFATSVIRELVTLNSPQ